MASVLCGLMYRRNVADNSICALINDVLWVQDEPELILAWIGLLISLYDVTTVWRHTYEGSRFVFSVLSFMVFVACQII